MSQAYQSFFIIALHNTVPPTAFAHRSWNIFQGNKVGVHIVKVVLELAWLSALPPRLIVWCIGID
jgi:hypothetical protein